VQRRFFDSNRKFGGFYKSSLTSGISPRLEESSGQRRRLGHITKQGNSLLRFLLLEAAQVTVRSIPEWGDKYFHLAMRRGRKIAKVAMARRLAVQMYWMWRKGWDYEQLTKFGSHAGPPGNCRCPFCADCHLGLPNRISTPNIGPQTFMP